MNIVIVGGGFGGIKAALELSKSSDHQITLISNSKYFQYYPTLYSTATGGSYRESWAPLDAVLFDKPNVAITIDTISTIEPDQKTVVGESGTEYAYDKLILSLGSVTTYFGIEGLDTYAFGIKSEQEIRKLQQHLFEEMSDGSDDEKHYVIIGGGPTGVELAGALGEYIQKLRKQFNVRNKHKKIRINLVEAAPRLLPRLAESSSRRALKRLKKLGVHVETGKVVQKQTADSLVINGKPIKTQTVIWTSGVANAPFYKANEAAFKLNERSKVVVDESMQAREDVYVIGDNAATPYAGLAQTALHDAIFVAGHINGSTKSYKAKLPACVIPIGEHWALFEYRWFKFGGFAGDVMHRMANFVGYWDVLPLSWAIGAWRAGTKPKEEMKLPDLMES